MKNTSIMYFLCFYGAGYYNSAITVEPPIKDPPKKEQPLNNGHIPGNQTDGCSVI